jgi:hypothetical protein
MTGVILAFIWGGTIGFLAWIIVSLLNRLVK